MGMERVLLLFDESRPFWTEELIELAGEDPAAAVSLEKEGYLEDLEGGFRLTGKGRKAFLRWAAESYLESKPGGEPADPELEGLKLKTALLFERGFKGFQGTKKVTPSPRLEYFPRVPTGETFSLTGGTIAWGLLERPEVVKMASSFPRGRAAEGESLAELEGRVDGLGLERVTWSPHALCLNQCDYAYYWRSRVETDRWGLLNTDRLFLNVVRDPRSFGLEEAASDITAFSLFLLDNRHVYLPGRFDIDVHQQSSFSWWFWATRTEEEARELARRLRTAGRGLVAPAEPADAWTISLEALGAVGRKADSFYEFVDDLAIPVTREESGV
jgi:hypothetical protein